MLVQAFPPFRPHCTWISCALSLRCGFISSALQPSRSTPFVLACSLPVPGGPAQAPVTLFPFCKMVVPAPHLKFIPAQVISGPTLFFCCFFVWVVTPKTPISLHVNFFYPFPPRFGKIVVSSIHHIGPQRQPPSFAKRPFFLKWCTTSYSKIFGAERPNRVTS